MRRSFDHFDLVAPHYDRMIGRAEDDPLPSLVGAQPGDLILDVGGGTGRNAHSLGDSGTRVIVCDRSLEMLRRARAKNLVCVQADVRRLPFPDNSCDRVVAVDSFHHFVFPTPSEAQQLGARQMLRVLRPEGRVVIEEPDIRRRGVKLLALGEKLLLMRSRFLHPDALAQLFMAAGAARIFERADHFNVWIGFQANTRL